MAIDKIIPRFLVSDKDERLLEEGAMTDALNVSISENGSQTEGVIKAVKGTIAATAKDAASQIESGEKLTVIGSVSDHSDGIIYFFCADDNDNGTGADSIYKYTTSNDQYELVYSHPTFLNFSRNNPVKADIIKRDFNDTGSNQTVIYFNDGVNPPRKINVERAIAGNYTQLSYANLDFALNSIKAAPNKAPTIGFETDANVELNNFTDNVYQFATQVVYNDGEESAISPYSKVAFSKSVAYQGVNNSAGLINDDNVCVIRPNISISQGSNDFIGDVAKIRILAKAGNDGAFFVVDEVDPTVNLTRNIYGSNVVVFNSANSEYRWYNEGVYTGVDSVLVNKLFDNIPLKAEGQALAGRRLFYSNYVEGFDNVVTNATITVNYEDPFVSSTDDYDGTDAGSTISESSSVGAEGTADNGDIFIDLLGGGFVWPDGNNGNSVVPAGTRSRISFNYDPRGEFYKASAGVFSTLLFQNTISTPANDLFSVKIGFGPGGSQSIPINAGDAAVSVTVQNSEDVTVNQLANLFQDAFNDGVSCTKTYSVTNMTGEILTTSGVFIQGNTISINCDITLTYMLDQTDTSGVNDADFVIEPYISNVELSNVVVNNATLSPYVTQVTSDDQSDFTYDITNTTSYINTEVATSNALNGVRSFKAGSTHELGVVYYDKYNRSGFVNKIGSFYVKPFSDRPTGKQGMASITVSFSHEPPPWAAAYQLVYPGASTYESFVTYTTGGAYAPKKTDGTLLTDQKRLYVSLNTLEKYKDEKGALRDYSFTVGDKLRVISYDHNNSSTPDIRYPAANNGQPIEFDIVGVEVLSDSNNPIAGTTSATVSDQFKGIFLVLEAPAIESNFLVDDDSDGNLNDSLKYAGFDWFSVNNQAYGDNDQLNLNYWGRNTVVEILTPRKTTSNTVYYEIGECHRANVYDDRFSTQHGLNITTSEGDVHWRQVATATAFYDGAWTTQIDDPDTWRFEEAWIESSSISDFFESKDWSRGRAHVAFERAAERRVENGIIYGDAYEEDVENLSLTSFNPSLANFSSLNGSFGPLNFLGNYNDDLCAIQKNKLSFVPVNKNIIEYSAGSANVAVSTQVLGQPRYSSGDYGCGDHPEAVLIQDNNVFFVDKSRQAVLSLSGGQLTPISEKGMSSFFEGFFAVAATKYVSGYDPRDDMYYVTRLTDNGQNQLTVGYDVARGRWQSKYSFTPDYYASLDNMMYSGLFVNETGDTDTIFWKHDDDANRNRFYGNDYASEVEVVSKLSPSRVKIYKSISIEGDGAENANWDLSPGISTDLGQVSGTITSWTDDKEGSFYAAVPRDTSLNSTSEFIYLGNLFSSDNTTFTSANVRIDRLNLPLGVDVVINSQNVQINSVSKNTFTLSAENTSVGGTNVNMKGPSTNGDVMRGHWAKIKLTNSSFADGELYAINVSVADSKYHHALGEQ